MARIALLASLIAMGAPLACADDALPVTAATTRTYTPADFVQYAPRTALDMVTQIPGFSIDSGDNSQRGFGQASANILINGQRISGKSNSVTDALSRITAQSVERIEIMDGASLDIPGLSGQIANVIARADGLSGTWEWEAKIREALPPAWDEFEVSLTGQRGNLGWTLSFGNEPIRNGARGPEQVFDGAGTLIEVREEDFTRTGSEPEVSGSLAWTPSNGHIANLTASYALFQPNAKEVSQRQPLDGRPQVNRIFKGSEDEWSSEIGGDYELGLGPGRLKLIGLWNGESVEVSDRIISAQPDGTGARQQQFDQTIDTGETIARAEYAWSPRAGMDWQFAAEGAFNFLDSASASARGPGLAPLPLVRDPVARVEEVRGEASVTYGQKISDALTLQTSLGIEQSEISQTGANAKTQAFTRPKGFINATYVVHPRLTLIGRIERRSGQLDFFDFIASSDIDNGIARAANPDLSPQQSWLGELEIEANFGDWGAGTLTYSNEQIEDLVDRIPLRDAMGVIVGDAVGNIDRAAIQGLELDATLRFDPIGLTGAQLSLEGELQTSQVDDPLTGLERRVNGGDVYRWEAEFRHDIAGTDLAYGIEAREGRDAASFFLDLRAESYRGPVFTNAFIEHKDIYGMTGFVWLGNLIDQKDRDRLEFYDGNRLGSVVRREVRNRPYGPILTFGLSGSF